MLFVLFDDVKFNEIKVIILVNGVKIVLEMIVGFIFIIGIFIDFGLKNEIFYCIGVLYLLECMVFKSIVNCLYFCFVCEVEVIGGNVMVNVFWE